MKYITTPVYYVNDIPHIGHAYTTILADILKKYYKIKGDKVYLLTGTDEHGQKIENAAKLKNIEVEQYTNEISMKFKSLWDIFLIEYDYFARTTNNKHEKSVQSAFEIMFNNGDIYKGEYEGNYCIACEAFFTKSQLLDNNLCPDCKRTTNHIKEENYFFALSKYQDKLLNWYMKNPNIIYPSYRLNEVINFIKIGLNDLSITRSSFKWGIKLPDSINDKEHIIYVWLDALLSYITSVGFPDDIDLLKKHTFNMQHFVGKDILRFHAIYWPAFLMSLSINLPSKIYVHGWWMVDGKKMSKSIGNVVNPKELIETYGIDVVRYFLTRDVSFGQDGDFSSRSITARYNSDLSDTLGNLLNRLIGMSEKYFNLNFSITNYDFLQIEVDKLNQAIINLDSLMTSMSVNRYLEDLWKILDNANLLITKYSPWKMIKNGNIDDVKVFLAFISNVLIKSALLLYPIMPESSNKILGVFKLNINYYHSLITNMNYITNFNISKIPPLFPKIDLVDNKSISNKLSLIKEEININQFNKIDIRVGRIISANKIENSNKLLKFQIDFGNDIGIRQIVSGIAEFYDHDSLKDKLICAIVNLKPSKIFGNLSEGMILTSEDNDGKLSLISVDSNISVGSKVL